MPNRARVSLQERLRLDKEDETLVWDLQETGDRRDERLFGRPCYGRHRVDRHQCRIRNQHALILKCRLCRARLLYVPVRGSTSEEVHQPAPKAKAKAKSRIRHTDGPDWQDFVIHASEEDSEESTTEASSEPDCFQMAIRNSEP